jgi:hypothetical protein
MKFTGRYARRPNADRRVFRAAARCHSRQADPLRRAGRPPWFRLTEHALPEVSITTDATATTLTSGRLSARVARGDVWRVEFVADGRAITSSGAHGMGIIDMAGDGHYLHEQLALGVGEQVMR